MGIGVRACTVWHASLSSHGTVGLYSHGTVGLFSHGAGGVPAPDVFLARLRLACVVSVEKFGPLRAGRAGPRPAKIPHTCVVLFNSMA